MWIKLKSLRINLGKCHQAWSREYLWGVFLSCSCYVNFQVVYLELILVADRLNHQFYNFFRAWASLRVEIILMLCVMYLLYGPPTPWVLGKIWIIWTFLRIQFFRYWQLLLATKQWQTPHCSIALLIFNPGGTSYLQDLLGIPIPSITQVKV